jgi:hypothetical protein
VSKNEWIYSSVSPICLHGIVRNNLILEDAINISKTSCYKLKGLCLVGQFVKSASCNYVRGRTLEDKYIVYVIWETGCYHCCGA